MESAGRPSAPTGMQHGASGVGELETVRKHLTQTVTNLEETLKDHEEQTKDHAEQLKDHAEQLKDLVREIGITLRLIRGP